MNQNWIDVLIKNESYIKDNLYFSNNISYQKFIKEATYSLDQLGYINYIEKKYNNTFYILLDRYDLFSIELLEKSNFNIKNKNNNFLIFENICYKTFEYINKDTNIIKLYFSFENIRIEELISNNEKKASLKWFEIKDNCFRSLYPYKDLIINEIEDSINTIQSINKIKENILIVCSKIINSIKNGGKIIIMGNGGSAGDAQHMSAEFINRFKINRKPIPSICLNSDICTITAISNDYSYDDIFLKQCQSLYKENDIIFMITTSGNSSNLQKLSNYCKEKNWSTICLTGPIECNNKIFSDYYLNINGNSTGRIQEGHILVIHMICEIVEDYLFKKGLI